MTSTQSTKPKQTTYWRVDVMNKPAVADALGEALLGDIRDLGLSGVQALRTSRIFLIGGPLERREIERIARELLADPVCERFEIYAENEPVPQPDDAVAVEVHLKSGVMDPVAESTMLAIADMHLEADSVRTAHRYLISPRPDEQALQTICRRVLANDCIEDVVIGFRPAGPPPRPQPYTFQLRTVPLRDLDEAQLAELSRQAHLFLSVEEMREIQRHYRALGRDPTDLELETFAQTWSEHCVHKTFKSSIIYRGDPMPAGPPGAVRPEPKGFGNGTVEYRYGNLLTETIVAATEKVAKPWCLSVFVDNAGIIEFDDRYGVAFKVETHNHPSAIEPYGGAATGIGGVIRDIVGCGLAAKPVANTDVFCFGPPDWPLAKLPRGVLHPRRIAKGVVAGVRDYGNRMGIPTVNGAVYFDSRYLGNPLVYCGCLGLIPKDKIDKAAQPGDVIVVVGGRTGRDGIHGATFSSAELTDTHADEFAHAVQIGNPITEKKFVDVLLQARDHASGPLYRCITDCGAGGLSSAVGEMAERIGAEVDLEKVPLKYAGLRYDEIWISEAQERMVLAVPPERLDVLLDLFASEDVEATAIGRFRDDGKLVLRYEGHLVGQINCRLLHKGLPRKTRTASWRCQAPQPPADSHVHLYTASGSLAEKLLKLLGHPSLASKHWIIRQYDHEVQGGSALKPLTGKCNDGPADAAVVRPVLESEQGVAIGCGLAPHLSDWDPYWMAVAAMDEAIRNVICVGAEADRIAVLDNFCWGKTDDPEQLGSLVRAAQGCHDAAVAFDVPFISGKDSLNNEFVLDEAEAARLGFADSRISIPGTLLISAVGLVERADRCVTMDLKAAGNVLLLVGPSWAWCGASAQFPFDWQTARQVHRAVAALIEEQLVAAAHDCSEGGILAAVAEMCIAGRRGAWIDAAFPAGRDGADDAIRDAAELRNDVALAGKAWSRPATDSQQWLLAEAPSRYIVEVRPAALAEVGEALREVPWICLGVTGGDTDALRVTGVGAVPIQVEIEALREAWQRPLDW